MRRGTGKYGAPPGAEWWGNFIFADPTRASLRRGMMNSPQNSVKFYDTSFGYGGVQKTSIQIIQEKDWYKILNL